MDKQGKNNFVHSNKFQQNITDIGEEELPLTYILHCTVLFLKDYVNFLTYCTQSSPR